MEETITDEKMSNRVMNEDAKEDIDGTGKDVHLIEIVRKSCKMWQTVW